QTKESDIILNPASNQPIITNADADNSTNAKLNPVSSKQNNNQPGSDENFNVISQPNENLKKPVQSDVTVSSNETTLTRDALVVNKQDEKLNISVNSND